MKKFRFSVLLLAAGFAGFAVGNAQPKNILREGLSGRWTDDDRTVKYVTPSRILWHTPNVSGTERLLKPGSSQVTADRMECCLLDSRNGETASLLLDFGKELHGGIRIASAIRDSKKPLRVRIRLGESVSEAMSDTQTSTATNDHAMRDFTLEVPWLGVVETGNSGFRFARIDLSEPDCVLPLAAVTAAFKFRDIPYLGSFVCNDPRLNRIWETGAYTVHLNMQDYVWDGIKRDRLVWLGDLHPELMSVNTVFGDAPVLRATLDFGRDHTPLPGWMNGMCSYSLWWIISHRDLYLYRGDLSYLAEQRDYLHALTDQILADIRGNREMLSGQRFLDWPTSENPEIIHTGLQALTRMALDAGSQIGAWLGDRALSAKCEKASGKLAGHVPNHGGVKQAAALLALSGLENAQAMSREVIAADGARRFSTFYGYYMLEAMAAAGDYERAMEIISDYWGAMLDLSATSFWEDLNYEDALKASRIDKFVPEGGFDLHARSGAYCYEGFRGSFCHGWAAGPTPWLSKHILGIAPVEPGCRTVRISPHLGKLDWAKGTFPTPFGIIEAEHRKGEDGKIRSRISVPKGIRIVWDEEVRKQDRSVSYR